MKWARELAAKRYKVAPIAIDPMARISVTAGRLALGSPKGQALTAKAG